jgi:hypothetical protein
LWNREPIIVKITFSTWMSAIGLFSTMNKESC